MLPSLTPGVIVVDAQATPVMAGLVIDRVRQVTDKPIKYVTLTHYHAVRVLGASGYKQHGLQEIIASRPTWELIVERGQQDMDSEIGRFPRLFNAVESVPGLTWPTLTFSGEMTLWMGKLEVRNTFNIPKIGTIAGSYVTEGKITRGARARLVRDGTVVWDGKVDSLRRHSDDVREVAQGFECGIVLENFQDVKEGDMLEVYETRQVERELV